MSNFGQFCYFKHLIRKYGTKISLKVVPDENMMKEIGDNVYKPRNHPGILKPRMITLPDAYINAISTVVEDFPVKALVEDAEAFNRKIRHKVPPIEKDEAKEATQKVQELVQNQMRNFQINSESDQSRYQQAFVNNVSKRLKNEVYTWKPEVYDVYFSLVYLMGRCVAEYAALVKIFSEINLRDSSYKPRKLFDFGSGVGTVTWAANEFWKKSLFEYFNVDSSSEMNDLAQIILQGGKGTKKLPLKGVFYRQFLPASNATYDLVVSAFTLLELPSRQSRLETIVKLWNKTDKYLVIVEHGTNAGFKLVNEARDFILDNKKLKEGHVFSPCPHDALCPRYVAQDNTPCNFQIFYGSLPLGTISERKSERYSYVVFKKGPRDPSDPQWPRLVRETLVRSQHSICRMCTKHKKIEEIIFTNAKHGKTVHHCARASRWGDRLPINLEENAAENCIPHEENEDNLVENVNDNNEIKN